KLESNVYDPRTYWGGSWSCERSTAVAAETARCEAKTPSGSASRAACAANTCTKAARSPWRAVEKEQREIDACIEGMLAMNNERECRLVRANACTGLVGLVCTSSEHGKEPATRVFEFRFEPRVRARGRP